MITTGLARIGKDAELRYTSNNEPVCNISLAYNYGRKGDDGKRRANGAVIERQGNVTRHTAR